MGRGRTSAILCILLAGQCIRVGSQVTQGSSASTAGEEETTTVGKSFFGKLEEVAENVIEFAEGSSLSEEFPPEAEPDQPSTTISATTIATTTTIATSTTTQKKTIKK